MSLAQNELNHPKKKTQFEIYWIFAQASVAKAPHVVRKTSTRVTTPTQLCNKALPNSICKSGPTYEVHYCSHQNLLCYTQVFTNSELTAKRPREYPSYRIGHVPNMRSHSQSHATRMLKQRSEIPEVADYQT